MRHITTFRSVMDLMVQPIAPRLQTLMCSRLYYCVFVSTLYDDRTTIKSPNDAFLGAYLRR